MKLLQDFAIFSRKKKHVLAWQEMIRSRVLVTEVINGRPNEL